MLRDVTASVRWLAGLLSLLLIVLSSGCTTVARTETVPLQAATADHLETCCEGSERYPAGLVALADPIAPSIGRFVAGMVWRKGHLLRRQDAMNVILSRLQPLDVVTVSNKGRLSGHAIPGLFGHAAVYVGTEDQLRRTGVWDRPAVRKHHTAIREGAMFIEADNKGVHLSTAPAALDADAITVLRPTGLSNKRKRQALTEYYTHLGMPFDYWFDLETKACTFCTELVNSVLPELRLPPRLVYGRWMIVPDEVVAATLAGKTRLAFQFYMRSDWQGARMLGRREVSEDLHEAWPAPRARPLTLKPRQPARAARAVTLPPCASEPKSG